MSTLQDGHLRLVVLGAQGAGKSTFMMRFQRGRFVDDWDPTVEDSVTKQLQLDGGIHTLLDILDSVDLPEFNHAAMQQEYLSTADLFVIVFSVTDKESFEKIPSFYEHIKKYRKDKPQFLTLVGTKKDISDQRQVKQQEAELLAKKYNAAYVETSLKDDDDSARLIVEGLIKKIWKTGMYPQRFYGATKAHRGGSRCLLS